ncbi:MAG TPA: Asp-tRNA(Asn)/Glu-tRNA(Gln) amidotransferase subunit GatA [Clostridia bacterium]|nr:Asp-tRNA(Asn)/Glu-tRNA(Gln) amidotransferase subunit GatA [Clostridia bacterium]
MSEKITGLTVSQLSRLLQKKSLSSAEVVDSYLEQIEACDPEIQAYITITAETARKQAARVDRLRAEGLELPPLAGIPAGIKDNICTRGINTTCASKMLENFVPPYDASVMEKLEANHVVVMGKLNMDEFAMGSTTENSHFKKTRNPRNPACVPGGSSGGSAAAVAADEAAFALGSDTGGSIRQPASFCGVVGMKPTYGTVSRYGLIAFASSLDQIGPLTKDVRDSALVLGAITGQDHRDSTSVPHPVNDFTSEIEKGVEGFRIALPKEYFSEGISPDIKNAVLNAAMQYEKLGAQVDEVSLPSLRYALPAYYVISSAEASSNLARFDGVKYGYRAEGYEDIDELYRMTRSEGFGKEVKRRIMLGSFVLSAGYYDAYYKKALQVRTLIVNDLNAVFDKYDFILSPVSPTTAYKLGEKTGNPLEMYLGDIFTVPINIAGVPSLSIPCGESTEGLPIGMQLVGKAFDEATLYRAAYAFEQSMKECTASEKGGRS